MTAVLAARRGSVCNQHGKDEEYHGENVCGACCADMGCLLVFAYCSISADVDSACYWHVSAMSVLL